MGRWGTKVLLLSSLVGALAFSSHAAPAVAAPPTPVAGFTTYVAPAGMGEGAGEPSIGTSNKTGKALFQAGTETLRVGFDEARPAVATWDDASYALGAITLDPILYEDPVTGHAVVSQLVSGAIAGPVPVGCSLSAVTDDDGATWVPAQGCSTPGGADHQTVGGGPVANPLLQTIYPHGVYYCSQNSVDAVCGFSRDGGLTYGPSIPIYTLNLNAQLSGCSGLHGHIHTSPHGTAYVPNFHCGGAIAAAGNEGRQAVVVTEDDGTTWAVKKVRNALFNNTQSDPAVGVDDADRTYFAFEDGIGAPTSDGGTLATHDGRMMAAASPDHGSTWTPPFDLGAAVGVKQAVMPTISTGSAGRAAVAFLGTTTASPNYEDATFAGVWHQYVALTYDGGATWTTIDTTPTDPVQRGCIYWGNGTCPSAQRNLLDFIDVTHDASGRVLVGYADGCTSTCVAGPTSNQASKATIARLDCGKGLEESADGTLGTCGDTTTPVSTCRSDARFADPAGDAVDTGTQDLAPTPGAPNEPTLDILEGSLANDADSLALKVRLADVAASPPLGAQGRLLRFTFFIGGNEFEARASDTADPDTFSVREVLAIGGGTARSLPVTGSFDLPSKTVTITIPRAAFATTFAAAPTSSLVDGTLLTGFAVIAQRDTGAATLTADSAAGACPYALAAEPTTSIPELAQVALLPGTALLGAALVVRRRRRRDAAR